MLRDPLQVIEFALGREATDETVLRALSKIGTVEEGEAAELARTFLDTFDGRLLREGWLLEIVEDGSNQVLVWRRIGDGAVLGVSDPPGGRFVWDLDVGPLRSRLEPVLEMRALLPLVRVRSVVRPLALRNSDGKLVVKASLEHHDAAPADDGEWSPLPPLLRLEPVRGYGKELSKAVQRVERLGARGPAAASILHAAMEAIGSSPPDYSNKVRIALQPDETAAAASRRVMLHLLDAMEANEEGTRLALDTEFLHDFRVAVRRTRSALGQIKGVFTASVVDRFRAEFAWLGTVTGPARDLDVYLLSFPGYRAMLPAPMRPDLEPLHDLLLRRQKQAQQHVARALRSRRYSVLTESWRSFLEGREPVDGPRPTNADRPIAEVAEQRIRRVFDQTLAEGLMIDGDSAPEEFHELRKTCKKLRYLMEFFQCLYSRDSTEPLIRSLKTLQDNLGEYQDLSVQIESMREFEDGLQADGAVPATALRAIDVLVDAFHARQAEVRSEFAARFRTFSSPNTRALLDDALRSANRTRKGRPV